MLSKVQITWIDIEIVVQKFELAIHCKSKTTIN